MTDEKQIISLDEMMAAARWLDVPLKSIKIHFRDDRHKPLTEELKGAELTTMIISGNADISLFDPHDCCIRWP